MSNKAIYFFARPVGFYKAHKFEKKFHFILLMSTNIDLLIFDSL